MKKVYVTKGCLKISVDIKVGEERRTIVLDGGSNKPRKIQGKYVSNTKEEQDAIEAHPLFNKNIVLGKVGDKPLLNAAIHKTLEEKYKEVIARNTLLERENFQLREGKETPEAEKPKEEKDASKVITGITNGQQAKAYLLKTYPDEFNAKQLSHPKSVTNRANEKGLTFPDWETK